MRALLQAPAGALAMPTLLQRAGPVPACHAPPGARELSCLGLFVGARRHLFQLSRGTASLVPGQRAQLGYAACCPCRPQGVSAPPSW